MKGCFICYSARVWLTPQKAFVLRRVRLVYTATNKAANKFNIRMDYHQRQDCSFVALVFKLLSPILPSMPQTSSFPPQAPCALLHLHLRGNCCLCSREHSNFETPGMPRGGVGPPVSSVAGDRSRSPIRPDVLQDGKGLFLKQNHCDVSFFTLRWL